MKNTSTAKGSVVMDVLPWPNGYGFAGGDSWWQHTLSQTERERMDDLLGLALLDSQVYEQLVLKHDLSLLSAFGFSEETQRRIARINATTLDEFAQAVLVAFRPYHEAIPEAA